MFTRSAAVYDAIHSQRFSASQAADSIHIQIQETKQSEGKTLLDVACGMEHISSICAPATTWKASIWIPSCSRWHARSYGCPSLRG